jgi:hypothetical protein
VREEAIDLRAAPAVDCALAFSAFAVGVANATAACDGDGGIAWNTSECGV